MSYIVFARKWRPQTFGEIVGQEHISITLKNAIKQDRVAHAYLFSGPRGTGKTSTARILAKALNCSKGPTPTPCNKCDFCIDINKGKSLDILEIDGASNRGIDQIRNLRENIKFSPHSGRFKVYIIDEVHMLTQEAFNALLKTLEEPPSHVKFIFATTAAHKVIPTILSRCQRFNFHRLSSQNIIKKLKSIAKEEKISIEESALLTIVKSASGSMRDAESIMDQLATYCKNKITAKDANEVLGAVEQDDLCEFAKCLVNKDASSAIKLVNRIIDDGIDPNQFAISLIEYFRSAMLIKEGKDLNSLLDLTEEEIAAISKQTESFSVEDILYITYSIINTNANLRRHSSPRVPLELLAVKLTRKESVVSVDEIIRRLTVLEKKTAPSKNNLQKTETKAEHLVSEAVIKESVVNEKQTPKYSNDTISKESNHEQELSHNTALYRIREVMPQVIKDIMSEKIYVASCLKEAKFVNFKNRILALGFLKKNTFHKESLEKQQNKKLIEGHLSRALGANIIVEFNIIEENKESLGQGDSTPTDEKQSVSKNPLKKALSDPIIKTALDIFDGNIMKFM